VRFRVWAPRAETSVALLLNGVDYEMSGGDDGWWHSEDLEAWNGARYAFRLDGGEPRPDPRAIRLPDGPEGEGEVFDVAAYHWADTLWRGTQLPGAVLYEMHVGTFTPEGTLDSAIGRLDHLVSLGIDLIELMPLATFPGRFGWGYDGVGLYAVHEPYGGPDALCRFVEACHERGVGVFLDVVYNHLGPSGNHLSEFGPYFTDKYGTPWGSALNLDDADSDEVRRFIIDNALMWFHDFHIDGLRLDAVHALFDDRAITLLEELSAEVGTSSTSQGRPMWLIAESDRNDPLTVTPREAGGMGLHAQWADDVHHGLHVLLTAETQGYYADFAAPGALTKVLQGVFLHDGTYSTFRRRTHGRPIDRTRTPGWRFVVSLQNHDQVGNRALGDRLSAHLSPGLLACGAALLLTGPCTPMLFMGEEWGASTPWQYFTDHTDRRLAEAIRSGRRDEFSSHGWDRDDVPDPQADRTAERSRLDWDEVLTQPHAGVLRWYAALIRLRREVADLGDPRLDRVDVHHDHAAQVIVVHRGAHHVAVNLSDAPREVEIASAEPEAPSLEVILSWDAAAAMVGPWSVLLPPESAAILGPVAT
jgi:maltooligosyltrehalose trehalohydrolase